MSAALQRDRRLLLTAQAARAFGYGFTAVLLGTYLDRQGWSSARVGVLLACVLIGTGASSLVVAFWAERIGRRRMYRALHVVLAATGVVFATSSELWVLCFAACAGALSTEVLESGPFTSLEQAMLPETADDQSRVRLFGIYNAVATIAGSLGALAAGGPELLRRNGIGVGDRADQRMFALLTVVALVGATAAWRLSPAVDGNRPRPATTAPALQRSRPVVLRLAGLFALDSLGGGFAVQSFLVFYLARKFDFDAAELGLVFFVVGFVQAGSFFVATRLAERIGLLNTMVFTHLPSNVLLASIALAPNGAIALTLLFARFALSQMDVPTRQAYVVALVDPSERVAASAYTSTAKYLVRPIAPVLAGVAQRAFLGLPLIIAGGIKCVYDLTLWRWLRSVPLAADSPTTEAAMEVSDDRLHAHGARPA